MFTSITNHTQKLKQVINPLTSHLRLKRKSHFFRMSEFACALLYILCGTITAVTIFIVPLSCVQPLAPSPIFIYIYNQLKCGGEKEKDGETKEMRAAGTFVAYIGEYFSSF